MPPRSPPSSLCPAYKFRITAVKTATLLPCRAACRTPATDVDPAVEECTGPHGRLLRVSSPGAVSEAEAPRNSRRAGRLIIDIDCRVLVPNVSLLAISRTV